jgi:hypothetical protein
MSAQVVSFQVTDRRERRGQRCEEHRRLTERNVNAGSPFEKLNKDQEKALGTMENIGRAIGVEIPRNLRKMVVESEGATKALASLFSPAAALGWAAVVATVAFEAYSKIKESEEQLRKFRSQMELQRAEDEFKRSGDVIGKNRELRVKAETALAGDIKKINVVLADDLLQNQLDHTEALARGDLAAARNLETQKTRLLMAAAAERQAVLRAYSQQTRAMEYETNLIGLKGAAQILQTEKDGLRELQVLRQQGGVDEENYQRRRADIHRRADREITELVKTSNLQQIQLANQTQEMELEGDARILTSAFHRKEELERIHNETFGALAATDQRRVDAARTLAQNEVEIDRQAQLQIIESHRQFAEQTTQMNIEAAQLRLPPWLRTNQQLIDDGARMMRDLKHQLDTGAIDYGEYGDRKAAIENVTNAKIVDANRQMVQQLGSDLNSLADDLGSGNIAKRMLDNAKKLFFQIIAAWVLQMKSAGGKGNLFSGLLGSLIFGPGSQAAGQVGGGGIGSILGGLFGGSGNRSGGGGSQGSISSLPGVITNFSGGTGGSSLGGGSVLSGGFGGFGGASGAGGSAALGGTITNNPNFGALFGGGGGAASSSGGFSIPGTFGTITSSATKAGGSVGFGASLAGLGASLGPLAAMTLGQKFGGTAGSLGAMLASLAVFSSSGSSAAAGLSTFLDMNPAIAALIGPVAGGLVGFGIGQNFGKTAGALSGAGTGALAGFFAAGPIGAIIGGIIGLLGGIFGGIFGGGKRKRQANELADKVLPELKKIRESYDNHQLDYGSAIANLDDLQKQVKPQFDKLKGEGKSIYSKRVLPELTATRDHITQTEAERVRRALIEFAPPQFASGGLIIGGPAARASGVIIEAHEGERVMTAAATARNGHALQAMEAGRSVGGATIVIHAIDSADVDDWLSNRGGIRALERAFVNANAAYAGNTNG